MWARNGVLPYNAPTFPSSRSKASWRVMAVRSVGESLLEVSATVEPDRGGALIDVG